MKHHRQLGQTGPDLPALGYGAMSIGNAYGPVDDDGADSLLSALVDRGIAHVDTSNVYGQGLSETRIGCWVARNGAKFHIATKGGITRRDGERVFDNSLEHLSAELEGSLKRLNVETVDLYYVHRREAGRTPEELGETLTALVRSGKTRAVGLSEVAPTTLRAVHAVCPIAAVQSEYSLQTRLPDLGLVQTCAELSIALVAFSPVGRGLLTDHPPSRERIDGNFFLGHTPRFAAGPYERNLAFLAPLRAYAADIGLTLAGLATAWVLERGPTLFSIPGTRTVDHLDQLVEGARRGLAPEEMAEVERLAPVGWCEGDRYSPEQWVGPERYC
jgi:aryl-alcohol dehydrogenase-like predicted oxidoreductase